VNGCLWSSLPNLSEKIGSLGGITEDYQVGYGYVTWRLLQILEPHNWQSGENPSGGQDSVDGF
jgi:hypothetical protein